MSSTAPSSDDAHTRAHDYDGTAAITFEAEQAFLKWFDEHGGQHPKILYPSRDTVNEVRGAVAVDDIHAEEVMIVVPRKLMMASEDCDNCPFLAPVFQTFWDTFKDEDMKLALFLMNEKVKGDDSFWAPYLRMLPRPLTICEWSPEELKELQDENLVKKSQKRSANLRKFYDNLLNAIDGKLPDHLDPRVYTFDLFLWAWRSIQARAFGRFLPWTALVPFADCLNHANVSVKYTYTSDKKFMMRPTKTNHYSKGNEVFNSYGRRANKHLLLEYGFAMLNNEWESYSFILPKESSGVGKQRRELLKLASYSKDSMTLYWNNFSEQLLLYYRIRNIPESLVEQALSSWMSPLDIESEIKALFQMRSDLCHTLRAMPTKLDDDEKLLHDVLQSSQDRLCNAVKYRVTRKEILQQHIEWIDVILPLLQHLKKTQCLPKGDAKGGVPPNEGGQRYIQLICKLFGNENSSQ